VAVETTEATLVEALGGQLMSGIQSCPLSAEPMRQGSPNGATAC